MDQLRGARLHSEWAIAYVFALKFLIDVSKGALFPPASVQLFWAIDLVSHLLIPIVFLWVLWRWYQVGPSSYRLTRVPRQANRLQLWPAAITYTLFLTAAYFAGYLVGLFLEGYAAWPRKIAYGQMIPTDSLGSMLVILYFSITAGVFEEVFYRGIFQLACDTAFPYLSRWAVVLSSGSLFAAIHWPSGLPAVIGSFFFGLIAAWLYAKQRDLRPLAVAHVVLGLFIYIA